MFNKAIPVWLDGLQAEMNIQAVFTQELSLAQAEDVSLRITAATLYRVYVNGAFAGYGPARAPHGCARVDELPLDSLLRPGKNTLRIEVAGYCCYSFYTVNQPSFLCAELTQAGRVLCATGQDFKASLCRERVQKVMRYSYQRTFSEVWEVGKPPLPMAQVALDLPLTYLPRAMALPDYTLKHAATLAGTGTFRVDESIVPAPKRYIQGVGNTLSGFAPEQISHRPYELWQKIVYAQDRGEGAPFAPRTLAAGQYALLDMGRNHTGFISLSLLARAGARIFVTFDEKLINGAIDPHSIDMINLIDWRLPASEQERTLESFEAYGLRYAAVLVLEGEITLHSLGVRSYVYPVDVPPLGSGDAVLDGIYTAAVETYRQNTLDVYMDCPTRERAGWLADSLFTARSERCFTGKSDVERVFMDSFRRYDNATNIPRGMLPMCYPGDHPAGEFIPQWAMWYVVQLKEFLARCPDVDKEDYRRLCYGLRTYLRQFRNADGLLEKLPGWGFVEWSRANEWVRDVNYPTNMLYAKMLEVMAHLYGDNEIERECRALREKVISLSFDGALFVDHAVRDENGRLINCADISETCQYYAIFFDLIGLEDARFASLYDTIANVFGPQREQTGALSHVEPATPFLGLYMRMDVLRRLGRSDQLLEEIKRFYGHMAEQTGTLWEHKDGRASRNHGFASYAGVVLRELCGR